MCVVCLCVCVCLPVCLSLTLQQVYLIIILFYFGISMTLIISEASDTMIDTMQIVATHTLLPLRFPVDKKNYTYNKMNLPH